MAVAAMLAAFIVVAPRTSLAGNRDGVHPSQTEGTNANDMYRAFLINNIFSYYGNNGAGAYNKFSGTTEGFEFTKGSGKTTVYEDGIVWGGYHRNHDSLKVGGSVYIHGLQAGAILTAGTPTTAPLADDPTLARNRIYCVRPDIKPGVDFSSVEYTLATEEVAYIGRYQSVVAETLYNHYIKDWNEWPADQGAPFTDVDHDGVYDPTVDIPGQPGADQTLWYVANDLDGTKTQSLSGSDPIGLEMQKTIWGFKRSGTLGDAVFTNTVLVNKSGAAVDSMFLVQWSDPDLGDGADDFVGCDTSMQMGFVYNGAATDPMYGAACPALGYILLQGPKVPSPSDSALFRGVRRPGYRNLPMTGFDFFTQGNPTFADPVQGASGNVQWYNLMNGRIAATGAQFVDPYTSQPTKFALSGDPVRATDGSAGWVDGLGGLTPQDRRMCLITGPFTMADGDTQEVVVATMAALGSDRISSITALRAQCQTVNSMYGALVTSAPAARNSNTPVGFALEQNFPNPFNPTTRIRFSVGRVVASTDVRLVVYDLLGREVAVLADGRYPAGQYTFTFDGSTLSSGVYYYRLTAGGFTTVRTMTLVK